jgi:hypothetical protein
LELVGSFKKQNYRKDFMYTGVLDYLYPLPASFHSSYLKNIEDDNLAFYLKYNTCNELYSLVTAKEYYGSLNSILISFSNLVDCLSEKTIYFMDNCLIFKEYNTFTELRLEKTFFKYKDFFELKKQTEVKSMYYVSSDISTEDYTEEEIESMKKIDETDFDDRKSALQKYYIKQLFESVKMKNFDAMTDIVTKLKSLKIKTTNNDHLITNSYEKDEYHKISLISLAAKNNDIKTLEYLFKLGFTIPNNAINPLSVTSSENVMKFLFENRANPYELDDYFNLQSHCYESIKFGRKLIFISDKCYSFLNILNNASDFNFVQWVYETYFTNKIEIFPFLHVFDKETYEKPLPFTNETEFNEFVENERYDLKNVLPFRFSELARDCEKKGIIKVLESEIKKSKWMKKNKFVKNVIFIFHWKVLERFPSKAHEFFNNEDFINLLDLPSKMFLFYTALIMDNIQVAEWIWKNCIVIDVDSDICRLMESEIICSDSPMEFTLKRRILYMLGKGNVNIHLLNFLDICKIKIADFMFFSSVLEKLKDKENIILLLLKKIPMD